MEITVGGGVEGAVDGRRESELLRLLRLLHFLGTNEALSNRLSGTHETRTNRKEEEEEEEEEED